MTMNRVDALMRQTARHHNDPEPAMHVIRASLLFACIALGGLAIAAEPPAKAEEIKVPLPWKQGQVLQYQFEQVETKTRPGAREKSISTSMLEVKTVEAGKEGFVQHWRSYDNKQEVLEGDKDGARAIADAMKGLEDLALVVDTDADGLYKGMRNLDEVAKRLRAAMQPVMLTLLREATEKNTAALEPAKRKEAIDKVEAEANAFLDRFTQAQVLEGLLTRDIQTVLNFSGAELEDDQAYELETTLENPTGGAPFPAKLTFGLYVEKESPEDVWLEWRLEIDAVKGAAAIWDTVERLYGRKIDDAERKTLPAQVSIVDTGFIVFERATGMPELYQYVRNTKIAENANYERRRMRLLGTAHDHEWVEENPQDTEPELAAEERDAQLCADHEADVQAAIAACSRALERKDLSLRSARRGMPSGAGTAIGMGRVPRVSPTSARRSNSIRPSRATCWAVRARTARPGISRRRWRTRTGSCRRRHRREAIPSGRMRTRHADSRSRAWRSGAMRWPPMTRRSRSRRKTRPGTTRAAGCGRWPATMQAARSIATARWRSMESPGTATTRADTSITGSATMPLQWRTTTRPSNTSRTWPRPGTCAAWPSAR